MDVNVKASFLLSREAGNAMVAAGGGVFLASRHASFVNGATINVSGGLVMY
ncbi:MAG: hypothetical protein OXI84_01305 [bacterium]|nr:hypothetical protein [bacterium]